MDNNIFYYFGLSRFSEFSGKKHLPKSQYFAQNRTEIAKVSCSGWFMGGQGGWLGWVKHGPDTVPFWAAASVGDEVL